MNLPHSRRNIPYFSGTRVRVAWAWALLSSAEVGARCCLDWRKLAMKSALKLLVGVAALTFTVACGSDDDDDGGDGSGGSGNGSSVPIEDVPAAYATAACEAYERCAGSVLDLLNPGEDCAGEDRGRARRRAATLRTSRRRRHPGLRRDEARCLYGRAPREELRRAPRARVGDLRGGTERHGRRRRGLHAERRVRGLGVLQVRRHLSRDLYGARARGSALRGR